MRTLLVRHHLLVRLLLVLGLAGALTLVSSSGCASANAGLSTGSADGALEGALESGALAHLSDTGPGPGYISCANAGEWGPEGLAPVFSEKTFWVILGLVILGWLVLAADFPANES